MTDSPHRQGYGRGEPDPYGYSGYPDPAYANQAPYGPPGVPPHPTQQLPTYSQYQYADPYATGGYATGGYGPMQPPMGEPPQPPRGPSRRWLWVLAAISVVAVLALVVAMVIVNTSSDQTAVAPSPSLRPAYTPPLEPPTTTSRTPRNTTPRTLPPQLPFPLPGETTPGVPTPSRAPGPPQSVVYTVEGDGRAMSITYVDADGVLQMEFNVLLPWTRQVELAGPANESASVTIVNFGGQITCSITVDGKQVEQQTSTGITLCRAGS